MQSSVQRILTGAIFFAIVVIVAIVGYTLAGWSFLDAVYMVVITIFGVGYGEVQPLESPALRVFTIFVIVAGTSSAVYTVGGFVQAIAEGEVNRVLGARRMLRDIEQLQDHIIVCGFGRIGRLLGRQLADRSREFVVVDDNPDRAARARDAGYLVLTGNATDETVLEQAGIRRAKVLATALPDDAANVFITLTARGMNPALTIVARGEYPTTEKKLLQAGADRVVLPATIGALRMAHIINHPAALDFLEASQDRTTLNELLDQIQVKLDELAIAEGSTLAGATIGDVGVRGKGTFIVVALRTAAGETLLHPPPESVLGVGDTVIVMGHRDDIPQFARSYHLKRQMRYRGARL